MAKTTATGTERITFFVPGIPRPGGSKKGFYNPKAGRVMMTKAGGELEENWRQAVSFAAMRAMGERPPFAGPVVMDVVFFMPRPKSHYRTGKHAGELRPDAPRLHTKRPDKTKLIRGTEDAMTGIVFADDCLVWGGKTFKFYGARPGAMICVILGEGPESAAYMSLDELIKERP